MTWKRNLLFSRAHQNRKAGFSLTELAIVLGVAGAVVGGIWTASTAVWENYRVGAVVAQVSKSVNNIRDHYNGINIWTPLGWVSGQDVTKTLDGQSLLPVEMRANATLPGNTNINHALGANNTTGTFHVLIEASPFNATYLSAFRIQLLNLTQTGCEKLLMAEPLNDGTIGIVQLQVIGSTTTTCKILNGVASSCAGVTPMLITTAKNMCNLTNGTNEVDLDFKLHN